MTDLETYIAPTSEKPADLVTVLARVAGLRDVIDERESEVRSRLESSVRRMEEASGGQFTVRAEAGSAYIAGGNPKPYVTDVEAFADWLGENTDVPIQERLRVEVIDATVVADALDRLRSAQAHGNQEQAAAEAWNLGDYLKVVVEPVLPKDAADGLLSTGRAVAEGDRLVDTSSGETVPGVAVRYSREQLTVRPDKAFRASVANQLRAELPALDGGAS